jgi:carbon monoxide dehydrogenase subunit G
VRTSESIDLSAPPVDVFAHVAELHRYPSWLPLVHAALPVADDGATPAWEVEIRARVGPLARSKRLRMERTELVEHRLAVFERAELDGRQHARWALRAELEPVRGGTRLTMHLAYDGSLWTAGVLERVLDDEIRRGRAGLAALLAGSC